MLCDLEGKTRKEAARQLGVPEGTLSGRLTTARRLLAGRLARHGLTLSGGALVAVLAQGMATACMPASLAVCTVKVAVESATATGLVSAKVAAIAEGVMKAMWITKLKTTTGVLLLLGVLSTGVTALALPRLDAHSTASHSALPQAPAKKENSPPKDGLEEFKKLYGLPAGEVLKRVAPPYPAARQAYLRQLFSHDADNAKRTVAVYFRWRDGELLKGPHTIVSFGDGHDASPLQGFLLEALADIYPQEMEGDQELLAERILGDFVVREGTPAEKVISRLEEILRRECKLPVKLALREVERQVIVASGKYRFTGLPGRPENQIQVYGKHLVENGGGGGSGDMMSFLKAVGNFVERRVVGEIEGAPGGKVTWQFHRRSPVTEQEMQEDTDPEQVLKHLSEQTGLRFKDETRRVRVLFVERAREPGNRPQQD